MAPIQRRQKARRYAASARAIFAASQPDPQGDGSTALIPSAAFTIAEIIGSSASSMARKLPHRGIGMPPGTVSASIIDGAGSRRPA